MLVAFLNAFVVEIIVVVETAVAVEAEGVDINLRQVFRREKEA